MVALFRSIQKYIKSRKYILIFSLIYFAVRLIYLNSYFLLRDERDLILTALSLAQTGKDLYGNALPLVFLRISPQAPLLGMYWVVPIISFFHISSPLLVKFLYLLPTLFFPVLVYELIVSVIKERKISFLTAFIISFSPWYFHISRLGIEAHLAYFFCLLGFIFYLKNKKTVGLALLLLGYFSYFGIRPFLLVAVPYIELWNLIKSKGEAWRKMIISVVVFIMLFGGVYYLSSRFENTAPRSNAEVIFLNKDKLSLETNFLREISDAPFVIREFFDNKASIILYTLSKNFFKGLDFSYLFFSGDYVAIYANQITGQFFPFLFAFFIIGICYLAKKKRSNYYFIAGFSLVGLVSSLINSYSLTFSVRSVFSLIGIGFICALGIISIYEETNGKRWKSIFVSIIMFMYVISSINFIYKYLFQNYNAINSIYNEQERYVAQYTKKHRIQTIIVPNIHSYFLSYLSTQTSHSSKLFQQVQIELNKNDGYILDGHRFVQCTSGQINPASISTLPPSTIVEESCLSTKTKLYLTVHKSGNIIELLDPEYKNNDINRNVKYYFFK